MKIFWITDMFLLQLCKLFGEVKSAQRSTIHPNQLYTKP